MSFYDFVCWLTGAQPRREWCVRNHVTGERVGHHTQLEAIRLKDIANADADEHIFHVWRAAAPDPETVLLPGDSLHVDVRSAE